MFSVDPPNPIHNAGNKYQEPHATSLSGTEPIVLSAPLDTLIQKRRSTLVLNDEDDGKHNDKMRMLSCNVYSSLDRRTRLAFEELRGVNAAFPGEDSRDAAAQNGYRPTVVQPHDPPAFLAVSSQGAVFATNNSSSTSAAAAPPPRASKVFPSAGASSVCFSKTDDAAWLVTPLGDCYAWVPVHDPVLSDSSDSSSSSDDDDTTNTTTSAQNQMKPKLNKRSDKKVAEYKKQNMAGKQGQHGAWELAPSTVMDFRAYRIRNKQVPVNLAPHGSLRSVACGGKRCVWAVTEDSPGAEVWEGGDGGGRIVWRAGYLPGTSLAPTKIKAASEPTIQRTGLEWHDFSDDVVAVPNEICLRGAWFSAGHPNKGSEDVSGGGGGGGGVRGHDDEPTGWAAVMKALLFTGERGVGESPTGLEEDTRDQALSNKLSEKLLPREKQGIEAICVAFARREWDMKFETLWAVHPNEYTGCFGKELSTVDVTTLVTIPSSSTSTSTSTGKKKSGGNEDDDAAACAHAESMRQLLPPIITSETKDVLINDYNVSSIYGILEDFERRARALAARGVSTMMINNNNNSIAPPMLANEASATGTALMSQSSGMLIGSGSISVSVAGGGGESVDEVYVVPIAPVSDDIATKASIAADVIQEHLQFPMSSSGSRGALKGLSSTFSKIGQLSSTLRSRQFDQISIGQDGSVWATTTEDVLCLTTPSLHTDAIAKFNLIDHSSAKPSDVEHNPLLPLYEKRVWTRLWSRNESSLTSEGSYWVEADSGLGALVNAVDWRGHCTENLAPMSVRGSLSRAMELCPRSKTTLLPSGFTLGVDNLSVSLQLPSYTITQLAHTTRHQLFAVIRENAALLGAGTTTSPTNASYLYHRVGITEQRPQGSHWQRVRMCPYAWPTLVGDPDIDEINSPNTSLVGRYEPYVQHVSLYADRSTQGLVSTAGAVLASPSSNPDDAYRQYAADITSAIRRYYAYGTSEVPLLHLPEHPGYSPSIKTSSSFNARGSYHGDVSVLLSQVLAETSRVQLYRSLLGSSGENSTPPTSTSTQDGITTSVFNIAQPSTTVEDFISQQEVLPSVYVPIVVPAVVESGGSMSSAAISVNGGVLYGALRETLEKLRHDSTIPVPDVLKCTLLEVAERSATSTSKRNYEIVVQFDINQATCEEELPQEYFVGHLFDNDGAVDSSAESDLDEQERGVVDDMQEPDEAAEAEALLMAEADRELAALEVQGSYFTLGHTTGHVGAATKAVPPVGTPPSAASTATVVAVDRKTEADEEKKAQKPRSQPKRTPLSRPVILATLTLHLETTTPDGPVHVQTAMLCVPHYHTVEEARHIDWQLQRKFTKSSLSSVQVSDPLVVDHQLLFLERMSGVDFNSAAELERFGRLPCEGSAPLLTFPQHHQLLSELTSHTMRVLVEFIAPTSSQSTTIVSSSSDEGNLVTQRTVHIQFNPEDVRVLGEAPRAIMGSNCARTTYPMNEVIPELTTIRIANQQHTSSWISRVSLCSSAVSILMPLCDSVSLPHLEHLVATPAAIKGLIATTTTTTTISSLSPISPDSEVRESIAAWIQDRHLAATSLGLGAPNDADLDEESKHQQPPRGLYLLLSNGPCVAPIASQRDVPVGSKRSLFNPSLTVVPHGGIFVGGWWTADQSQSQVSTAELTLMHSSFAAPTHTGVPTKTLSVFLFTSLLPPTSEYMHEESFFSASENGNHIIPCFMGPISARYQPKDRLLIQEKSFKAGRAMPVFPGQLVYSSSSSKANQINNSQHGSGTVGGSGTTMNLTHAQLRVAVRSVSSVTSMTAVSRFTLSLRTDVEFSVYGTSASHNNLFLRAHGEVHAVPEVLPDGEVYATTRDWNRPHEMIFMGVTIMASSSSSSSNPHSPPTATTDSDNKAAVVSPRDVVLYKDGGDACATIDGMDAQRRLGILRRPNVLLRFVMSSSSPKAVGEDDDASAGGELEGSGNALQITHSTNNSTSKSSKAARKRISAQKWVFGNNTTTTPSSPDSATASPITMRFVVQPTLLLLISASQSTPASYPTGTTRTSTMNPYYNNNNITLSTSSTASSSPSPSVHRVFNTWEYMGCEGFHEDVGCGRLIVSYPLCKPDSSDSGSASMPEGLLPNEILSLREVLVSMGALRAKQHQFCYSQADGRGRRNDLVTTTVADWLKPELFSRPLFPGLERNDISNSQVCKYTLQQETRLTDMMVSQDAHDTAATALLGGIHLLPHDPSSSSTTSTTTTGAILNTLRSKGILRLLGGSRGACQVEGGMVAASTAAGDVYERLPLQGLDGYYLRSSAAQCDAVQQSIFDAAATKKTRADELRVRRFVASEPTVAALALSTKNVGGDVVDESLVFMKYDAPVALSGCGPFHPPDGRRVIIALTPTLSDQGQADYDVLMEEARLSGPDAHPSKDVLMNQIVHRAQPVERTEDVTTGVRCELLPIVATSTESSTTAPQAIPAFSHEGSVRGGGCVWVMERSKQTQKRVTAREFRGHKIEPDVIYDGDLVNIRCYQIDDSNPSTYLAPPHAPASITTWRIRKVQKEVLVAQQVAQDKTNGTGDIEVDGRTESEREADDAVAAAARRDDYAQYTSDATQAAIAQRAILRRDLLKQASERKNAPGSAPSSISINPSQSQTSTAPNRLMPLTTEGSSSLRSEIDRMNRQYQPLLASDVFTLEHPGKLHGCADDQKSYVQEVKREEARLISGASITTEVESCDVPFELQIGSLVTSMLPLDAANTVLPLSPPDQAKRDVQIEDLLDRSVRSTTGGSSSMMMMRNASINGGGTTSTRSITFSQWTAMPVTLQPPPSEAVHALNQIDDPTLLKYAEHCVSTASGVAVMLGGVAPSADDSPLTVFGLHATGSINATRSVTRSTESTSGFVTISEVTISGAFDKPFMVGELGYIAGTGTSLQQQQQDDDDHHPKLPTGPSFTVTITRQLGTKQPLQQPFYNTEEEEEEYSGDPALKDVTVPWSTTNVKFNFDTETSILVPTTSRSSIVHHLRGGVARVLNTQYIHPSNNTNKSAGDDEPSLQIEVVGIVAEVPMSVLVAPIGRGSVISNNIHSISSPSSTHTTTIGSSMHITLPLGPAATPTKACTATEEWEQTCNAIPATLRTTTASRISISQGVFGILRRPALTTPTSGAKSLYIPPVELNRTWYPLDTHTTFVLLQTIAPNFATAQDDNNNDNITAAAAGESTETAVDDGTEVKAIKERLLRSTQKLAALDNKLRAAALSRPVRGLKSFLATTKLSKDPYADDNDDNDEDEHQLEEDADPVKTLLSTIESEARTKAALIELLADANGSKNKAITATSPSPQQPLLIANSVDNGPKISATRFLSDCATATTTSSSHTISLSSSTLAPPLSSHTPSGGGRLYVSWKIQGSTEADTTNTSHTVPAGSALTSIFL